MQAGVLEYLISINDKGVQKGVTSSERTIKQSADKISAWTIAKGQMIASALTKTVKTLASTTKQLISSAVMSFANYEQIVGGAKLVWGDAFDFIEKRAKTAYKNVQMSATDYMQQANYHAVGLKNALDGDTEAAAELADKIITAQADIVAALGVDAERVQGAFTGIMRGNYTMLDNLGLGIAGTKQGMQDVIDKVNEWHKAQGRQTKYSMKSIADQQAALVDYVKMQGLAGYAEREGLETIQGSLAATKAAWKDMLTAFGSGVNVAETSRNFTKMLKVTLKNILPTAQRAVKNLFATVKDILPELKEILKSAWTSVKTSVKEFFGDNPLLQKLTGKIDDLMGFADLMGSLFSDFDGTVDKLKKSDSPLLRGVGTIIELGSNLLSSISDAISSDGLLGGLFKGTADFIGDTIQKIMDWINTPGNADKLAKLISDTITSLLNAATNIVTPLVDLLIRVINDDSVWQAILTLIEALGTELWNLAVELISKLLDIINVNWGNAFRGLKLQKPTPNPSGNNPNSGAGNGASGKNAVGKSPYVQIPEFEGYVPQQKSIGLWTTGLAASSAKFGLKGAAAYTLVSPIVSQIKDYLANKDTYDNITKGMNRTLYGHDEDPSAGEIFKLMISNVKKDINNLLSPWLKDHGKTVEVNVTTNINMTRSGGAASSTEVVVGSGGSNASSTQGTNSSYQSPGGRMQRTKEKKAKGDWRVPYDNFPALLHRDEMELTKSQARKYRDGEGNADYPNISGAITNAVEAAMSRVYVMLSGEKVGDLTTKRIKRNINASSYSKLRALGG